MRAKHGGRWRIAGVLVASFASLAASGPCVDEEAIREVEARRAALLSDRVPKEELWALMERRGRALERTAELRRAVETVERRITVLETRTVEIERGLEQLRDHREAIGVAKGEATAQRMRAESELASVQRELRALAEAGKSGAGTS